MTLNLTIPSNINDTKPKITVIGIGGAGGNAVNTMINANVENIEFMVANTDGQALSHSLTKKQIQLGKNLTLGLGAGSNAETGKKAAEESIEEILSELGDVNMLFITTGMGGGTGSGASPIIAKAARDKGILTVAVVTKPFDFEGRRRMQVAESGLAELKGCVDTLIVIPNQNLFKIANEKTTFAEAFKMADDVLYQGVCGITDLITNPGMINLDFADIKTIMGNMGKAMMGSGESAGEDRAKNAAEAALNNPLLDESSIKGAKSILLNIQGGPDMALFEVDEAASKIRNEVDENANIIFGSSIDNSLEGIIKVSVVATGIEKNDIEIDMKTTTSVSENKIISNSSYDFYEFDNSDKKSIEDQSTFSENSSEINMTNVNSEQIDIINEINQLETKDNIKINSQENSINTDDLRLSEETKEENLQDLLENKPENQFTKNHSNGLFKSITSFFKNDTQEYEKVEPNIEDKNILAKQKIEKPSVSDKLIDKKINEENLDLSLDKKDLFETKSEKSISEHQIDLIDIEQEAKEIDENVLEIPAFLRRQAN